LEPQSESLQLRECIFLCTVPFEGLQLQSVTIRDNNDVEMKSQDVEVRPFASKQTNHMKRSQMQQNDFHDLYAIY
jgi:hypothetical protein